MASSSRRISPDLACLVTQGKALASLLKRAKYNKDPPEAGRENLHIKVQTEINELLTAFKTAQSSTFLPKESIITFLGRLQELLQEFIVLDIPYKSTYESLVSEVKKLQESPAAPESSHSQSSTFSSAPEASNKLEEAFGDLTPEERRCLICFLLFPTDIEVKKRELVHLLIGTMNSMDQTRCEEMLRKLVVKGFIQQVILARRSLSRYKMHTSVRKMISRLVLPTSTSAHQSQEGCWSILRAQQAEAGLLFSYPEMHSFAPSTATRVDDFTDKVEAFLNISESTLNAATFKYISKMGNVRVLCLGNWHNDPRKYVVIEDAEVFEDLENLGKVKVLSLQGVSGIVKLPKSVCELRNLEVLDMKACHNLEFLPEEIDLLKNLTHLDLSECYQLDHVPKGITSLTQLQVLKGFVTVHHHNTFDLIDLEEYIVSDDRRCGFNELSKLKRLRKLTVRANGMAFPTKSNLRTLAELKELNSLRIAWASRSGWHGPDIYSGVIPLRLKKLELQAVAHPYSSQFLNSYCNHRLEKLYIRGGLFPENLTPLKRVKVVRLRYMPDLDINWQEFRKLFPELARLEIFECPKLTFPCDQNGVWEKEAASTSEPV